MLARVGLRRAPKALNPIDLAVGLRQEEAHIAGVLMVAIVRVRRKLRVAPIDCIGTLDRRGGFLPLRVREVLQMGVSLAHRGRVAASAAAAGKRDFGHTEKSRR